MHTRPTILLFALLSFGCNRDWDAYDPRLESTGPGTGGGSSNSSSSSSSGMGGQSSSSSSSGAGGSGGAGGMPGVGGAGGSGGMGGSGGSPCTAPLHDDFNDGAIDGATWEVIQNGVTFSEAGGDLVAEMPSNLTLYGELRTKSLYDFTGCGVVVQVRELPSASTQAYTSLVLRQSDDSYVQIAAANGGLQFKKVLANNQMYLKTIAYDPVQHAYWRIQEAAGITYWGTSPDGKQWQNWVMEQNPLPVGAMKVGLSVGLDVASPLNVGRARFDNLDAVP